MQARADNSQMRTLAVVVVVVLMAASASAKITDSTCAGLLHGVASNSENQPVPGVQLLLWPIGVDLGYVLPRTTTTEAGEYRFEHVCLGRFTVVVDDEPSGYPPSVWSYLLGNKQGIELTPEHLRIELPVAVPHKAASLNFVVRASRTNTAIIRTLQVKLRTAKVEMYDWITFNHNSSEPLLVPANTDLLCSVGADGYREWQGGKKGGKQIRLAPEDHITFNVELEPRR